MGNWLDDLEKKKRDDEAANRSERQAWLKEYDARQKAEETVYASVKDRVEPIFAKLEALVERANKNGFFLIAKRTEYQHGLDIFRYNAEEMRVGHDRNGDFQMATVLTRAEGNEEYLKGVAQVALYPKPRGLEISFTEADISMGWKKGKWHSKQKYGESKFYEHVGTVPYASLTEDDLAIIVKWIATGNEGLPRFRNVIPAKKVEPLQPDTGGCLYSPWTYVIAVAIALLLYLYVSSHQ
ncbi:MAG TPA: hypothetical protein DC054_26020 [Blastocatellia bacterium]|nr:hypothetical protein [Blastocatellia bacterium]